MSEARLTLVFRGPGVEGGEIDVRDLAPAMLAVGDLLQAANEVVNQGSAKVVVRVRSTAAGSFEVDLSVFQGWLDKLFAYALDHQDEIAAANDLVDLIFKVGTPVSVGLFTLLLWLRGRKPERLERTREGNVSVHIGDTYIVADPRAVKLAEDVAVRSHARKLVSVLEGEDIDSIAARPPSGGELRVSRDDTRSFALPEAMGPDLQDEVRRMTVQIIALSFKEDNKWKFTDGGDVFNAAITDPDFLRKIANREIAFGKGDYLVCDVRERQFESPKGLKRERTIVRVHEHRNASRQLRLT